MYKTGGLEHSTNDEKIMSVDGINYIVSDKFKSMLRDSFIDWGTFLEVYHNNIDYGTMFDQVVKLLNIDENENLKDFMLPLVKKIYNLPAKAHMVCMLKQFMIYEPVSIAIHSLFITIKTHYEEIVEKYINARNKYITSKELPDKINNLDALHKYWESMDDQYNLDSSSIILLFLNPPGDIKSRLNFNISDPSIIPIIEKLRSGVKRFHYGGFCPKVPHQRLEKLLEFPINEFAAAISAIDKTAVFPDYKSIEKKMAELMKGLPEKPVIEDTYKRKTPPVIKDPIELSKWYVDAILDLRKSLLEHGKMFENYYAEQAKILIEVNIMTKKEFERQQDKV